jgi:predicted transcriptional regulator
MSDRKTMTLNLTDAEMDALEELCRKRDLSKTAVMRQALRLYQLINARLDLGEKLYFEHEKTKAKSEVMVV